MRKMFEPTSLFDRVLYAALAVLGPHCAFHTMREPDLQFASFVMGCWSLICIFHTIEWALTSYRKWSSRTPTP